MKANRNFYGYALSLSRVPRQLPPGGSLLISLTSERTTNGRSYDG